MFVSIGLVLIIWENGLFSDSTEVSWVPVGLLVNGFLIFFFFSFVLYDYQLYFSFSKLFSLTFIGYLPNKAIVSFSKNRVGIKACGEPIWQVKIPSCNAKLTNFNIIFHFCTPWKGQKTFVIGMEHWPKMDYSNVTQVIVW